MIGYLYQCVCVIFVAPGKEDRKRVVAAKKQTWQTFNHGRLGKCVARGICGEWSAASPRAPAGLWQAAGARLWGSVLCVLVPLTVFWVVQALLKREMLLINSDRSAVKDVYDNIQVSYLCLLSRIVPC